jgi:hypothetical protein
MISQVTFIGDSRYSFQGVTEADVVRLVWLEVDVEKTAWGKKCEWRLCLHLRYPNGREDFVPLQEALDKKWLRGQP